MARQGYLLNHNYMDVIGIRHHYEHAQLIKKAWLFDVLPAFSLLLARHAKPPPHVPRTRASVRRAMAAV